MIGHVLIALLMFPYCYPWFGTYVFHLEPQNHLTIILLYHHHSIYTWHCISSIKVVQKTFNENTCDFTKTLSYCSGFMEREFKSDDQGIFSETWNFVPDSNTRKTIFGNHNSEDGGKQEQQPNYKKWVGMNTKLNWMVFEISEYIFSYKIHNIEVIFTCRYASLTIEITKNKDNVIIPRVIINPTALYQCKMCTKGFQTSTLLRLHTIHSHPQER